MGTRSFWMPIFALLAIAGAVLSTVQRESVTVPPWSIKFVDQLGRPFVGLGVEQSWRNYSLEDHTNLAIEFTNSQGIVSFPARTLKVSMLRQILGPLRSFLFDGGFHAGFGPDSSLFVKCSLDSQGSILSISRSGQMPTHAVLVFSGAGWARDYCAAIEAQAKEADRLSQQP
jgi:hypothetical protein